MKKMQSFIILDGLILWAILIILLILAIIVICTIVSLIRRNSNLQKRNIILRQKLAMLEREKYVENFSKNLKTLQDKKEESNNGRKNDLHYKKGI